MTGAIFDGRDLDQFEGMISADEAALLYQLAAHLGAGCIVEIGSWRGKSAVALAWGARTQPPERRPMVYCIEPHAAFEGIYGGRFGPPDRVAFLQALLRAECAEGVGLVSLPSVSAAKGWPHAIGLLFVDGNHTESAVQADVDAWGAFLVDGGFIAFDDALDGAVGPARVIARLVASGAYKRSHTCGKIVVLQQTPYAETQRRWRARAEALSDVDARADAAGYDPRIAAARLSYGSFVSLKHQYMYIETPKAACTSWKRLIVRIEGAECDAFAKPYHRETSKEMLIHQRRHVHLPSALDVGAETRAEILSGSQEWFVFGFSRNPFSRVVSVFENKVRVGEPGYRDLETRYGTTRYPSAKNAFAAFVAEVAADPSCRENDAHLRAQTDLLLPALVRYTAIFQIEKIEQALAAFSGHLRSRGYDEPLELERLNEGMTRPWRDYYDGSTADAVARIYASDFDAFAYDPGDWRGGSKDVLETDQERQLRTQIVRRNGMIDHLYDLLAGA